MSIVIEKVSLVLIALASILADVSILPERYQDRLYAQILLWLAASLQRASFGGETAWLINAVFFCSIVSAAYSAWRVRSLERLNRRADYSKLLAPSCLAPMIYTVFAGSEESKVHSETLETCALLFTISVVILSLWKWSSLRSARVTQDLAGIPFAHAVAHPSLDEGNWYNWTPSQVLQWISSLDDRDDEWFNICGILIPERIPGSVLESITKDDLRTMGCPFGLACRLEVHILKLTSRYPNRQRYEHYSSEPQYARNGDMAAIDSRMKDEAQSMYVDPELLRSTPPKSFMGDGCEVDGMMAQKARDLMRERFGFELPVLKTNSEALHSEETSDEQATQSITSNHRRTRHESGNEIAPPPTLHANEDDISSALMAAMPPNIREIAERKPDLIRQLLESKRSNQSANKTTAGGVPTLSKVQEIRMQANPSHASRFVGAQAAAELAGIEMQTIDRDLDIGEDGSLDSQDGEHTVLLRRRNASSR